MRLIDLDALPPGMQLRIRRQLLGVSQQEVAERMRCHAPRVCAAERDGAWTPPAVARFRERLSAELDALEVAAHEGAA